jgi:hypothetical protein
MGAAWAAKLKREDMVCAGYLGDGASSSGDFHAAANFAGVFRLPVVFFCQNNQWAISVPLSLQTASASIAVKATAYGFPGVRVDGNDILAVIGATRQAVERARGGEGPTLVEAVTFRMGGHSSSDDPTRYRDADVVAEWERRDPLARFRSYLRERGVLEDGDEQRWTEEINEEIGTAITEAEALPPPPLETMFTDVYREMPWHIEDRRWEKARGSRALSLFENPRGPACGRATSGRLRLARRARGRPQQQLHQLAMIHRLDLVGVESRLHRALAIFRLSVAGHRDDHRLGVNVVPESAADFVAVHSRQTDVQQDHSRTLGGSDREGLVAVVRQEDLMPSELEQQCHASRHVPVVIHHQDAQGRANR